MLTALATLALAGPVITPIEVCRQTRTCVIAGLFEVSSDGHGFTGQLTVGDSCLNVSIPDREARRLLGKEPSPRKFSGQMLPYIVGDDIFEQRVNGRVVGRGRCGPDFLFVK